MRQTDAKRPVHKAKATRRVAWAVAVLLAACYGLTPSDVHAGCGDYVTATGENKAGHAAPPAVHNTPALPVCSGPRCRGNVPPATPESPAVPTWQVDHWAVAGEFNTDSALPPAGMASTAVADLPAGYRPPFFRPPRI